MGTQGRIDGMSPGEWAQKHGYGFKKGAGSPNPGGKRKLIKRVLELFQNETEASLKLACEIRDATEVDAKTRLDAAKFICLYGLGKPPKVLEDDEAEESDGGVTQLTKSELEALARQSMAEEVAPSDADDSDETH